MTQIELEAHQGWDRRWPPKDARKAYVAKILGRETGPRKYQREFLGTTAELVEGDEGLYERQNGERKGGYTRYYHVVMSLPEYGLIRSTDCEDLVPRIAARLDAGASIDEIVRATNIRSEHGEMIFDAQLQS